MSNNTGWRHAYQGAISKVILVRGEAVREDESTYGWTDYDFMNHLAGRKNYSHQYPTGPCEIVLTDDTVYENTIYEFEGTDASSSYHHVAELRHCECTCGARKDFTMRYKGSLSDVLAAIEVLEDVAPEAVVPADEVDAQISIVTQGIHRRLTSFQNSVQALADTYATKAADPQTPHDTAIVLALCSADLLWALQQSEKP